MFPGGGIFGGVESETPFMYSRVSRAVPMVHWVVTSILTSTQEGRHHVLFPEGGGVIFFCCARDRPIVNYLKRSDYFVRYQ